MNSDQVYLHIFILNLLRKLVFRLRFRTCERVIPEGLIPNMQNPNNIGCKWKECKGLILFTALKHSLCMYISQGVLVVEVGQLVYC